MAPHIQNQLSLREIFKKPALSSYCKGKSLKISSNFEGRRFKIAWRPVTLSVWNSWKSRNPILLVSPFLLSVLFLENITHGKKDGKHQDTHQGQSNGQSHNHRQVFNFLVGLFIHLSLSRIQLKYCFDGQTSIPDEGSFHFCRLTVTPSYIMLVIDQWIDLFRLFTVSTKYNTIILS